MVHVEQQMQLVTLDNLEADAGALFQVEGTDKVLLVGFELGLGHRLDGDVDPTVGDRLLNDLVVTVRHEMAQDILMCIDDLAHGTFEVCLADAVGEVHHERQVIAHGLGIGLTLCKDTLLRETQPDTRAP